MIKLLLIAAIIFENLFIKIGNTSIATPSQRKSANCIGSISVCTYLPMIKFPDQNSTQSTNKKNTGIINPLKNM